MNASDNSWDVIVIGAGAAGMVAAARAANRSRKTLLIEKNRKLGVKILISGGTRCNITHNTDVRGIADAFPKQQARFLRSALAALPPDQVIAMLHREGVATKIEETGKIFPVSDRALDVRDAFARMVAASGCAVEQDTAVLGIEQVNDGFRVTTSSGLAVAARVIIACGGQSYPGCGTTGDGYAWSRQLGHRIERPVPALTPIKSPDTWLHELTGLTLSTAGLSVVSSSVLGDLNSIPKKAVVDTRQGSLLFTHFGLSGPTALDASRAITRAETPRNLALLADFLPGEPYEMHLQRWRDLTATDGRRSLRSSLSEQIQRRLADAIMTLAQVNPQAKLAEISKRELTRVVHCLKRCPIHVSGTMGFAKAEVTAGGVALDEIASKSMESRRVAGLFFAGEVLDIDGPIGGFNFQAAFSTGWLAGSSV